MRDFEPFEICARCSWNDIHSRRINLNRSKTKLYNEKDTVENITIGNDELIEHNNYFDQQITLDKTN